MLSAGSYLVMSDVLPDYIKLYRIDVSLGNSKIAIFNKSHDALNSVGEGSFMPPGLRIILWRKTIISRKLMPSLCNYSVNRKFYKFYWMCSKQESQAQKVYETPESWDIIFFQRLKSTLEDQDNMGEEILLIHSLIHLVS